MNGEDEELSVRMARYVAAEEAAAPPSRVDPALAVLRGRELHRRRAWTVASAVAAVALSVGSFAVLGSGGGAGPAGIPAAPQSASPSGSLPPDAYRKTGPTEQSSAVPVVGRTVLTVPGRFGWLPDSVSTVEYRSESTGVDAMAYGDLVDHDRVQFLLTAFPEGVTPDVDPLIGAGDGLRVDAAPVNGREAYWVTSSDASFTQGTPSRLRFRGADGIWYQLDSSGLPEADREQLPLRVAAGVVPGRYTPPLPVSLSSLPPDTVVSNASLRHAAHGAAPWEAELTFQEQGTHYVTVRVEPDQDGPPSGPSGSPGSPGPSGSPGPDANGFPEHDPGLCSSGYGVRWCVRELQPAADAGSTLPVWLARVLPRGSDERSWSADVLP